MNARQVAGRQRDDGEDLRGQTRSAWELAVAVQFIVLRLRPRKYLGRIWWQSRLVFC